MRIKVFTVEYKSFRYGESEGVTLHRFSTKELADEFFDKEVDAMRKISDLTEYEPNCFEDSMHKWAYDYKMFEELIIINEKEEGEFLNQLIIESRKDKLNKIMDA